MTNTILDELHATRERILAEHGNNLYEYFREGLARSIAAGHPVADIQQRRIRRTEANEPVAEAKTDASGVSAG